MKRQRESLLNDTALQALREAVAKVVEDHQRRGRPLAVWRDGKAVWVFATEAPVLREKPIPYRTKSHDSKR
jgi:hypothetical protein